MSYAEKSILAYDLHSGVIDAFGRLRVSDNVTILDSKQDFDNAPLIYDDAETSGTGTSSSHSTALAATTMSVSATTAGTRVRQTFRRLNYEPGKSHYILCTGVLGAGASGITRRVGYFDENNGLFFQLSGTTLSVVRRTSTSGSPVDTTVTQSNWNIDKLDGTGASGITLDTSKTQIMLIDFEWLGVGRVRFGFVIDGGIYYCHELNNANSLTTVYMSTPNLPVRYEISNDGTGAASDLIHICSQVASEGGQQSIGILRGISRGTSTLTTANDANWYPLISIRLSASGLSRTAFVTQFSTLCTSTADYEACLWLAPTIAGTDAASWTALSNSAIEYDISRDNTNTLSAGTILNIAPLAPSAGNQVNVETSQDIENSAIMGSFIDGTPQELVLAVRRLTGTTETFYANMTVKELL